MSYRINIKHIIKDFRIAINFKLHNNKSRNADTNVLATQKLCPTNLHLVTKHGNV